VRQDDDHYGRITSLLIQYLKIVWLSRSLAIATAIPAGILLTRSKLRKWAPRVIGVVNIGLDRSIII